MNRYTVLAGGGVGDAYINVCRLYSLNRTYGFDFDIIRPAARDTLSYDTAIRELYSMVPFIKSYVSDLEIYGEYCKNIRIGNPNLTSKYDIGSLYHEYLKSKFPLYTGIECFPQISIPKIEDENYIVVHTQGGRFDVLHGDTRGFNYKTVQKLIDEINKRGFKVVLLGKDMSIAEPLGFVTEKTEFTGNVKNLIGKTNLVEACSYVAGARLFIGFAGIFTFLAPSIRVKTVVFSHIKYNPRYDDINIGCPCWYEYMKIIAPIPSSVPIGMTSDNINILLDEMLEDV